jgi:hypothetical protein
MRTSALFPLASAAILIGGCVDLTGLGDDLALHPDDGGTYTPSADPYQGLELSIAGASERTVRVGATIELEARAFTRQCSPAGNECVSVSVSLDVDWSVSEASVAEIVAESGTKATVLVAATGTTVVEARWESIRAQVRVTGVP